MSVPSPRVQILDKIDELTKSHCDGCQIRENVRLKEGTDRAVRNCLSDCDIGKHLNKLGNMLLETKAKDSSKYKNKSVNGVEKLVNLTKEIYQDLKAQGKSDKWIMQEYLYGNGSFYKLKNTWGLIVGKGRLPDKPIKKKTLDDVSFSEEKPKNKELTKEKLQDLIAQGISNKEIQKMHGLNNIVFYQLKNDWGMVRKVKMRDEVEEKSKTDNINELNEKKELFDKNIYQLKVTLSEKDNVIKKLSDLISDDIEVTDKLKSTLFDKDNIIKNLHNLRSEDVLIIDKLKEKLFERENMIKKIEKLKFNDLTVIDQIKQNLSNTEEALELARNKIKGLEVDNNYLKVDYKIAIKKIHEDGDESVELKEEIKTLREKLNDDNEKLERQKEIISELKVKFLAVANEREQFKNKYSETFNKLASMKEKSNRIDKLRDKDAETILRLSRKAKQSNNCNCSKDKVFRLESLLAHSEKNNDDLIRQIKSLSKFRNMYFKTAEVLKIHLPN